LLQVYELRADLASFLEKESWSLTVNVSTFEAHSVNVAYNFAQSVYTKKVFPGPLSLGPYPHFVQLLI